MFLRKMIPNTLSFKLTSRYALVVIILITASFGASFFSLKNTLSKNMEDDLLDGAIEFKSLLNTEGLSGVKRQIDIEMASDDQSKVFFQLFDKKGSTIYSSDLSHWRLLEKNTDIIEDVFTTRKFVLRDTQLSNKNNVKTIYYLISPEILLYAGETTEEIREIMSLLSNVFFVMILMVIPLASIVCWLTAKQAVKGINEVRRIASEIEKGNLDKRVSASSQGEEITQLVNTFNTMLDRIRNLISDMKEMTDNIAHDLRSPVARIRAISELVLLNPSTPQKFKTAGSDTIEECDRLIQMINSILDVAEVEAGTLKTPKQMVNISQLVRDACEIFEPMAEQKHINLAFHLKDDCHTYGDIQNLQRMLANILDNAIKYTPKNGRIEVFLACSNKNVEIMIQDNGSGIPQNAQTRIFDRFFRCDQSRTHSGCGLGLSFSRAVARSHGGDINLVDSHTSRGSRFIVTLPVSHTADHSKGRYRDHRHCGET